MSINNNESQRVHSRLITLNNGRDGQDSPSIGPPTRAGQRHRCTWNRLRRHLLQRGSSTAYSIQVQIRYRCILAIFI